MKVPKDPLASARQIALRYLSHRPRTRKEMEQKLFDKGIDPKTVFATLEYLEKSSLIDDRSFARDWADIRSRTKFLGPIRLLRELEQKGVDEMLRNDAVESVFKETDEGELAFFAARKKKNASKGVQGDKLKRRIYNLLIRKGFSSDAVFSALSRVSED